MDLYTQTIDEFVDWKTGENSFTKENVTGGLQVSGGAIRDLIQKKLQNPFYMREDIENNKYRMFSSQKAYEMWAENPSDNASLELFNFVRPSDYKLTINMSTGNRFVRVGDTTNLGARIQYSWSISNDEGDSSDSLTATYTIVNQSSGRNTSFTRWYNKGDADPNFSVYEYLDAGTNTITIDGKGTTTGARTSVTFNIVLLQLNMASSFAFAAKRASTDILSIPYTFTRNNNEGSAKIHFCIDEGGSGKEYTEDVRKGGANSIVSAKSISTTLSEGLHTLQIWAEASYNDGSVTINSNLLYFTFAVASTSAISTKKYILVSTSFETGVFPFSSLTLAATQYDPQTLNWGYYTDNLQNDTKINVQWKLFENSDDENPQVLANTVANNTEQSSPLQWIPAIYSELDEASKPKTYIAVYQDNTLLLKLPVLISQNTEISIVETPSIAFKMSAYGRTNEDPSKDTWLDSIGGASTTFTGMSWDPTSGWYNNSFRTAGSDEYALIDYAPFENFSFDTGKTVEIEFETEKVNSEQDVLITIGLADRARIEITPTAATLYNNGNAEVVRTNYKSNERLKLAFIINSMPSDSQRRTVESGLVYIVNNGILERAAVAFGSAFVNAGKIKIGGSNSGVRVYNMRIYNYAISYTDAYNNYVYDSDNKVAISVDNNIVDASGEISYDLCKNKLDTILISGNLSKILSGQTDKDGSTTDVDIERICPTDTTKNFKITGAQIRKHGQSTLHYPITSMKFWLNKSKAGNTPLYETAPTEKLALNKNRYRMKNESIPANKFVLQANYADSSGVHNGSLLRLIQSSWFNARIDGEYKLRTLPQLFATSQTVTHTDANLYDVDDRVDGPNDDGKLWSDYFSALFPYDVRISADSFPCAVFYYDAEGTQRRTFLGQYVFMDDKKSDFLYGERSIYKVQSDPYCLTDSHKKDDTKENRVWNNKNVLRMEVTGVNNQYSSYMSTDGFTDIVEVEDETTGNVTREYGWESAFEMIYPDPDDIEEDDTKDGKTKFDPDSKYVAKAKPFVDFYTWLVSTRNNQEKFQQEAAQHLDLYKMAAYYIFVLRFGLVDSLERNAQLKTYDGVHWHYEPWDMDIALGNKNDGGIAYNPPIDRNTKLPGSVTTYAISGRSADSNGNIVTSNWLFDALEAWPYWINTIVPKVADALYDAGLTYDNISTMFDDNYAKTWCETIYNKSGYFKYIESGNGDPTWLSWLQGARMTHRHWWLSTSMDYYDAKWFCGDYKNHFVYLRANVTSGTDANIVITPNKQTYISVQQENTIKQTSSASQSSPCVFNVGKDGSSTKEQLNIYGANFIEEIDLSEIAQGLDGVHLSGAYSEVLGSPIKVVNIGTKIAQTDAGYTTTVGLLGGTIEGDHDVFENLQTLNIRGQRGTGQRSLAGFVYNYDISTLQNIYAMGSGIQDFSSSESGNKFNTLELPSTISTFNAYNTTWNNLTFWDADIDENNFATLTQHTGTPANITNIHLMGTSCQNYNSLSLVRSWLNAIVTEKGENALADYVFEADKINWAPSTVGGDDNLLTYQELSYIAQLNNGDNIGKLKGYIVLKNEDDTPLTSEQLTQIKNWFGDTVFTKSSSGLVIDHKLNYIQINVGGDVYTENGEVYLAEGGRASLNATRFSLAESDSSSYGWAVGPAEGAEDAHGRYLGTQIIPGSESPDGITYLQTKESDQGGNYDVKVYCSAEGQNYTTIIHIVGVTYPTDMNFAVTTQGSSYSPRIAPGYITLHMPDINVNVAIESAQEYTATIGSIEYSITSQKGTMVIYNTAIAADTLSRWDDRYMTLEKSSSADGLLIGSAVYGFPSDNTVYLYPLTATVYFNSGVTITVNSNIVIMNDTDQVVSSTQRALYNTMNNAWIEQFGSAFGKNYFYRTDLLALTGTLTFTSTEEIALSSLVTSFGTDTVLNYLPNITGIVLDNCTNITSTHNSITVNDGKQVVFDNIPNLRLLSIKNCTGLTDDVDLTSNTEIQEVYADGTTVNVLVPQATKLTNYTLGTPTTINLTNPTQITVDNTSVDDSGSITSIDLVNIPNTKSFSMFGKIMNLS